MKEKLLKTYHRIRRLSGKKTMVCYGTSLTSGSGWVKMLGKQLPDWCVINSAKGGMNSNWGVDHFQDRVLSHNPNVVLMEFTINDAYENNDFYRQPNVPESITNIVYMINELKKWCKVYYLMMNPPLDMYLGGRNPSKQRPDYEIYLGRHHRKSRDAGAEVIDMFPFWNQLSTEDFLRYAPDGLHPNELASTEITLPTIMKRLCLK